MEPALRWGHMNDLQAVGKTDQHVEQQKLAWKLQHEEIVLAEVNGELVGYLRLEYLWSRFAYIGLIVVSAPFRKRGIGRAMLGFLEAQLVEKGHRVLYSSSQVNEAEPQEWHRKMGFQECGIINGINEGNVGEVFFNKVIGKSAERSERICSS